MTSAKFSDFWIPSPPCPHSSTDLHYINHATSVTLSAFWGPPPPPNQLGTLYMSMLPNLPAVHAHVASSIITHLVFSCHLRPSATYFNQAPSTPEKQGGGAASVASILQWSRVDWDSFEIAILIYLLSSHEQIIGKN